MTMSSPNNANVENVNASAVGSNENVPSNECVSRADAVVIQVEEREQSGSAERPPAQVLVQSSHPNTQDTRNLAAGNQRPCVPLSIQSLRELATNNEPGSSTSEYDLEAIRILRELISTMASTSADGCIVPVSQGRGGILFVDNEPHSSVTSQRAAEYFAARIAEMGPTVENCVFQGNGSIVLMGSLDPNDACVYDERYPCTSSCYHTPEYTPTRNSVLTPNMAAEDIQPPAVDFNAPPPYDMRSMKLPTYAEVQREKALEVFDLPRPEGTHDSLSFVAIDTDSAGQRMATDLTERKLLGTDFMFGMAFILALVFNWIGFILLMCFCNTVAARYGALSGFGLSLMKWTIIVKHSTDVPIHNAWLWWLIAAFGFLICVRSLVQYINIKKGWNLMTTAMQERLLFFY